MLLSRGNVPSAIYLKALFPHSVILVLSFLDVLYGIHEKKKREKKMLTTTFVVKLYICICIDIDIFKEENNSSNFLPKNIHTFCPKDTWKMETWKQKKNLSQFFNFAFFRHSNFIFQLNFSPMENGYLRMQNLPRRNWKKAEHTIIYFPPPPDSLVCIYGGGPLCLKSSQPSLLRSPRWIWWKTQGIRVE